LVSSSRRTIGSKKHYEPEGRVRDRFEVAVIGGGPAGSLTAMLLARQGCRVAVFDKSRPGAFCVGETLPPQSSRVLTELGLFDRFREQKHRASPGVVSVWGSPKPLANDFLFSPHGEGWHIDRAKLNALLRAAAVEAGASLFRDTGVRQCTQSENSSTWTICTGHRDELECDFLVDASGRQPARLLPNPGRTVYDRLISIAGLAEPAAGGSGAASDFTLIEAVLDGWFYSALLPSEAYIVTFTTDADLYAAARIRSPGYLDEQLSQAPLTSARINRFPDAATAFAAVTMRRNVVVQSNWIAVGDAAKSYDPLSGLGILSAMKAAIEAAAVVRDMLAGQTATAAKYEASNQRSFSKYREMQDRYYSLERRWPDAPFWSRRHQGLQPLS